MDFLPCHLRLADYTCTTRGLDGKCQKLLNVDRPLHLANQWDNIFMKVLVTVNPNNYDSCRDQLQLLWLKKSHCTHWNPILFLLNEVSLLGSMGSFGLLLVLDSLEDLSNVACHMNWTACRILWPACSLLWAACQMFGCLQTYFELHAIYFGMLATCFGCMQHVLGIIWILYQI